MQYPVMTGGERMDPELVSKIMDAFQATGYRTFCLETGAVSLELKRTDFDSRTSGTEAVSGSNLSVYGSNAAAASAGMPAASAGPAVTAGPASAAGGGSAAAGTGTAAGETVVKAQMAGTFYVSPKPGEQPFVHEGSRVEKGDTLGLLEAMKMISEIPAPVSGVVEAVLQEDAAFAEFEMPLFRIREA